MTMSHLLVVDIGKTNLKVSVGAPGGALEFYRTEQNVADDGGLYPHFDIAAAWDWLIATISEAAGAYPVGRICVAAHGAAAALIHSRPDECDGGLALPVLDYEWEGVREFDTRYDALRPSFKESLSPGLPAGLNLGRQLFWQATRFPEKFGDVAYILPYAQYWTWRLSGVAASEVSSLGSHTDLWAPREGTWSSLVEKAGWEDRFAPFSPAWAELGPVLPDLAEQTGLDPQCDVLTGVHDSNAGFALFQRGAKERPTVVSTGTWTVTMVPDGDLDRLEEDRDMLANVDIIGEPVACARFMGGREYAEICARTRSDVAAGVDENDVQAVIDEKVFALPDFSNGSGPFGSNEAQITGEPANGAALAALYSALMIDLELDLLGAKNSVVIEGSFAENETLCRLVASLRKSQTVARFTQASGVTAGCFAVAGGLTSKASAPDAIVCKPLELDGLERYRDAWRQRCEHTTGVEFA